MVNKAKDCESINLEPVQYQSEIYYRTMRVISPGGELLLRKPPSINRARMTKNHEVPTITNKLAGLANIEEMNDEGKEKIECKEETEQAPSESISHDPETLIPGRNMTGPTDIKDSEMARNELLQKFSLVERIQYRCIICARHFGNWTSLRLHLRISHTTNKYVDFKFLTAGSDKISSIITYRKGSHNAKKDCVVCKRVFQCPSQLKRHLESHGSTFFTCNVCGDKFHRISALQRHSKAHPGRKVFICSVCKKEYLNYTSLKDHINIVHNDREGYKCDQCPAVFGSAIKLTMHRSTHDDQRELLSCPQCGHKYVSRISLKRHMFFKHGNPGNIKCHLCTTCGMKCQSPQRLRIHERLHTGERPFACEECDQTFRCELMRKRHISRCHAEKVHMCSTCGRMFSTIEALKTHLKSHHEGPKKPDLPPAQCQYCSRSFKLIHSLKRHIKQHHNPSGIVLPKQQQPCPTCGKLVVRLDLHMRNHSKDKKYKCNFCSSSFLWHSQLKRHCNSLHGGWNRQLLCQELDVANSLQQNHPSSDEQSDDWIKLKREDEDDASQHQYQGSSQGYPLPSYPGGENMCGEGMATSDVKSIGAY